MNRIGIPPLPRILSNIEQVAANADRVYGPGAGDVARDNYNRSLAAPPPFGPGSVGAARTTQDTEKAANIIEVLRERANIPQETEITTTTTLESLGLDFHKLDQLEVTEFIVMNHGYHAFVNSDIQTVGDFIDCFQ